MCPGFMTYYVLPDVAGYITMKAAVGFCVCAILVLVYLESSASASGKYNHIS
jgi:hypothetical protein